MDDLERSMWRDRHPEQEPVAAEPSERNLLATNLHQMSLLL
jgi:hypothetical protein